jgi:DNA-binding NarL/FixJ family response regulator
MKILVIDKQGSIEAGLFAIGAEVSRCVNEIQALNTAERWQPDLILVNFALRGDQTEDYIRLLLETAPLAKVVLLGIAVAEEAVIRCLLAGAKGYQELRSFPQYSQRLLQAVADGEAWVSRKLVASLIESARMAAMTSLFSSV